ncbi:MAG: hypothetical protein ABSF20_00185 [Smithella sp.]
MNKQPYLTCHCHLQVAMTNEMVCIDYREEAAYVSRKLKNQASLSYSTGKLSDIFHIDLTLKGSSNFVFYIRI